jgi:hypothetical protein
MSVIPTNQANIQLMLQNDAQQLRTTLSWVDQRYQSYNQNMTTANMTAAGISAEDQNTILAFIGDLSRLKTLASGTLPANATDMHYDCAAVLGIL